MEGAERAREARVMPGVDCSRVLSVSKGKSATVDVHDAMPAQID